MADALSENLRDAKDALIALAGSHDLLNQASMRTYNTQLKVVASCTGTTAAAEQAQERWLQLALSEESVVGLSDATARDRAVAYLQERDQVVLQLWVSVQETFYKDTPPESQKAEEARKLQESSNYKLDLIAMKKADMEDIFSRLDADVRKSGKDFKWKDALDAAAASYEAVTRKEALRAARESFPGCEVAWKLRADKSATESTISASKATATAASPFDKYEAHKLAVISALDRACYELLQRELKYFTDIKANWQTDLEQEKGRTTVKRLAAAREYFRGNPAPWREGLTPFDRSTYNADVTAANEAVVDKSKSDLHQLEEVYLERCATAQQA